MNGIEENKCGICFFDKSLETLSNMPCCKQYIHDSCMSTYGDVCIREKKDFSCPFCRNLIDRKPLDNILSEKTVYGHTEIATCLFITLKTRIEVEDALWLFDGNINDACKYLTGKRLLRPIVHGSQKIIGTIMILATLATKRGYFCEGMKWNTPDERNKEEIQELADQLSCNHAEIKYLLKIVNNNMAHFYSVIVDFTKIKQIVNYLPLIKSSFSPKWNNDKLLIKNVGVVEPQLMGEVIFRTYCSRKQAFNALLESNLDVDCAVASIYKNGGTHENYRANISIYKSIDLISTFATYDNKNITLRMQPSQHLLCFVKQAFNFSNQEAAYLTSFCQESEALRRFKKKYYFGINSGQFSRFEEYILSLEQNTTHNAEENIRTIQPDVLLNTDQLPSVTEQGDRILSSDAHENSSSHFLVRRGNRTILDTRENSSNPPLREGDRIILLDNPENSSNPSMSTTVNEFTNFVSDYLRGEAINNRNVNSSTSQSEYVNLAETLLMQYFQEINNQNSQPDEVHQFIEAFQDPSLSYTRRQLQGIARSRFNNPSFNSSIPVRNNSAPVSNQLVPVRNNSGPVLNDIIYSISLPMSLSDLELMRQNWMIPRSFIDERFSRIPGSLITAGSSNLSQNNSNVANPEDPLIINIEDISRRVTVINVPGREVDNEPLRHVSRFRVYIHTQPPAVIPSFRAQNDRGMVGSLSQNNLNRRLNFRKLNFRNSQIEDIV